MTQENKFAIIIGFALVLVVGILVSDHLAGIARGAPGSLLASDPLEPGPSSSIEFQVLVAAPTPPQSRPSLPAAAGMSDPVHTVAAGDSLFSISLAYYGDGTLADAIGTHNRLPNPNALTPGQRLIIPDRGQLTITPPPAGASAGPSGEPAVDEPGWAEYVVQPGDTLSELAQKLMGSARHTADLLSMNADRLRSADALRVGQSIRYPASVPDLHAAR
ncbi:MAG: LysM peptidoglycan-binding domain-containing protein [Phycisphaerales bacterium]|nr:LysM peptidoglycan-binding domain-containing protein [Phycisphaerales bacterium]